jgi:hypothetical protein
MGHQINHMLEVKPHVIAFLKIFLNNISEDKITKELNMEIGFSLAFHKLITTLTPLFVIKQKQKITTTTEKGFNSTFFWL